MIRSICPVCGSNTKSWEDVLDGWCLMEASSRCETCKQYEYHYAHGYSELTIGRRTLYWSYHNNISISDKFIKLTDKLVARAKKDWSEK